jgi:flavin reductase (DIM6/NTAB) family NADH-FMN oxidoreductase RutF
MTNPARQVYRMLKRLAFGDSNLPRQFTVGMNDPQSEIRVWLHGLGEPHDVTERHVMACVKPMTIGVVLEPEWQAGSGTAERLSLRFQERHGNQRLMGEIFLDGPGVAAPAPGLRLFGVRGSANYCLPKLQLRLHQLHLLYTRWRFNNNPEIKVTPREAHAMIVFFICPRPVVIVSVVHGDEGNVFPMNLMGPIGNGRFAFSLNSTRHAAPITTRAGKLAISSVPLEMAPLARQLGKNHYKDSIDMTQLPFTPTKSREYGLPVPEFAVRVREMEIEFHEKLGSHTFFITRLVHDERFSATPEFFYVHGIYQAWRIRNGSAALV